VSAHNYSHTISLRSSPLGLRISKYQQKKRLKSVKYKSNPLPLNNTEHLSPTSKVGVTTDELDRVCHEVHVANNAYPSPLNYYKVADISREVM
jgi:methionine aminopeptidase